MTRKQEVGLFRVSDRDTLATQRLQIVNGHQKT
jgi:hypothetical protein